MERLLDSKIKLPPEQLKWFMSFENLHQNIPFQQQMNYGFYIELIERKAFYLGYIELVDFLNEKELENQMV